jgi:phage terminase large subunit-like protein
MVGVHRALERQMTTWEPSDRESPDRLDALVWAVSELQIAYIPPSPTRLVRGDDDRPTRVIA